MMLAQAIVESGWGGSRFAQQGNALFGQWVWNKDLGIKPKDSSNNKAVVRSFHTLFFKMKKQDQLRFLFSLLLKSSLKRFKQKKSFFLERVHQNCVRKFLKGKD